MYVEHVKSKQGNKVYTQILLRESYREKGGKRSRVKHRTIANLTHCSPKDVQAIEWGLKHKHDLKNLTTHAQTTMHQGFIVGAVVILWNVARQIGLVKVFGRGRLAKLVLWLIFARLLEQGSRLSAVRLARRHAVCEILGLDSFNEDDLYEAMDWVDKHQLKIEKALFRHMNREQTSQLFLYDVTSSYLEGECNFYGAYGYNRDGKRGKRQIVIGLLTDEDGVPISVKVFHGNTQDPKTVVSQICILANHFDVHEVTFVGDRGMLKSTQIEKLNDASFHYVTAITKPQIETLLKDGILQLSLFDEDICEVKLEQIRYILRRNPFRAQEIAEVRADKFNALTQRAEMSNSYLSEHSRAKVHVAERDVGEYAEKLKISEWVEIRGEGRKILVTQDKAKLKKISLLDGCYVIKSDVPSDMATAEQLHARYKDLGKVEKAFRTMKSAYLELRPWFVRTAAHTRAHAFIAMLAYRIEIELEKAWCNFDLTVEEGLNDLSSLCSIEVNIAEGGYLTIPEPRESVAALIVACGATLPVVLPRRNSEVATKRTINSRRKKYHK